MRRGTAAVFGAAAVVGLYLVAVGGWPIALVGALSIAAGLASSPSTAVVFDPFEADYRRRIAEAAWSGGDTP